MKDHTIMNGLKEEAEAFAPELRKMMDRSAKWADRACAAGDVELSCGLRRFNAHLTMAYAEARGLKGEDGELIVTLGGGK